MKKFLLSLLVSIIGLISFGNCWYINASNPAYGGDDISIASYNVYGFTSDTCFICQNYYCSDIRLVDYDGNSIINSLVQNFTYCTSSGNYLLNRTTSTVTVLKLNAVINGVGGGSSSCDPQYTSEECQQEYGLMSISSCDSEFCQLNGMCSTGSSGSGDLQRSALFINGIQHVGGSIIDVTIPSEIQRNYIYTGENEETFKLDVVGLNGDPDYIQGIIDVNSYRPTSEDFTQTFVGGLTLVFPYIIITAIVLFIWRFIRKIFK